eukprot:Nitzschia sp. Nitz4//scaffold89_size161592//42307//44354//NITZ4_002368-RA/size161592-snap-gene-0.171-mRNA-1//-1//CDS//3329559586//4777//frame0
MAQSEDTNDLQQDAANGSFSTLATIIGDSTETQDQEGDQDDFRQHDQLPTVLEAKATIPHREMTSRSSKCSKKTIVVLGAMLLVAIVTVVASVLSLTKENDIPSSSFVVEENPMTDVDDLDYFLYINDIASLSDLTDPSTSQYKAASFVKEGNEFSLSLTERNADRIVERYVLALLYNSLYGEMWTYSLDFLEDVDHCQWQQKIDMGVYGYKEMGIQCNRGGLVEALDLSSNNMQGKNIPEELQYLVHMKVLRLSDNDVGGTFPTFFRFMSNLEAVELASFELVGTLPSWLGEMSQLTTLYLSNNGLYEEIPESIALLTNLRALGLDDNGFSGSMDLFKSLYNLESLFLEDNSISGNLTGALDQWPFLLELDVSNNFLTGPLPEFLLNHADLIVLDVNSNDLTGDVPLTSDSIPLQYLSLYKNQFQGPMESVAHMEALRHLDVSFNELTGPIPSDLNQLTDLRYLSMSGNSFEAGPLVNLESLTKLRELSMKSCNLKSTIPEWIGDLFKLQLLDLDANTLTGSIPSEVGLLTNLKYLFLNRNELTGTIPTEFGGLDELVILLLDSNSLSGETNPVCESQTTDPSFFIADCYPSVSLEGVEIECECCSDCCSDDNSDCNNKKWTSNVDLTWEYDYERHGFAFNVYEAPSTYSKSTP